MRVWRSEFRKNRVELDFCLFLAIRFVARSFSMHVNSTFLWFMVLFIFTLLVVFSVDRARASFKTKFGNIGLRDRGLRLAGYLTPPSDVTVEEEEANAR